MTIEPDLSLARTPFACQPDQRTKVILLPAAVSRFEPKKAPGVDAYDADIQSVVNRKDDEVIHQDQRDMNERSDAEKQKMHQKAGVRRPPSPKPDCALVFLEVNKLELFRRSGDFFGTGIRKLSKNPGIECAVSHVKLMWRSQKN
jgi:hypothetical protein